MIKERVHNLMEAKVLLNESLKRGEDKYHGCKFVTHEGEYLFTNNQTDYCEACDNTGELEVTIDDEFNTEIQNCQECNYIHNVE